MGFPDEKDEEDDVPETVQMAMDTDNLYAVDYLESQ